MDPYTGEACGALGFSWTAALTLDLLHAPAGADQFASHPGHDTFDKAHRASTFENALAYAFETGAKGGDRG